MLSVLRSYKSFTRGKWLVILAIWMWFFYDSKLKITNKLGNYHVQWHEEKTLEMDDFTKENVEWYNKFITNKRYDLQFNPYHKGVYAKVVYKRTPITSVGAWTKAQTSNQNVKQMKE